MSNHTHNCSLLYSVLGLCPKLSHPLNGTVFLEGRMDGQYARYTCNNGFELTSYHNFIRCKDGQWQWHAPIPSCTRKSI